MAKEAEKKEEELEEVAEEIESPKKGKAGKTKAPKAAGATQLPLLLMIGGALGAVIMIIVSVVIGTIIAQKLFPPQGTVVATETEEQAEHGAQHAEKLPPMPDFEEDAESEGDLSNLIEDGGWLTFNSGQLASNTKGSTTLVCALQFVADYKPYYVEQLTAKGFLTEAGVDAHGAPLPPGVDTTNALYAKLKQAVASQMMLFFNSKVAAEIHTMQSTGVLADTLKSVLRKPFKETGLQLGKVQVSAFTIAGM